MGALKEMFRRHPVEEKFWKSGWQLAEQPYVVEVKIDDLKGGYFLLSARFTQDWWGWPERLSPLVAAGQYAKEAADNIRKSGFTDTRAAYYDEVHYPVHRVIVVRVAKDLHEPEEVIPNN